MEEYTKEAAAIISKYTGMSLDDARKLYNETRGMAFRDQLSHAGVPDEVLEEAAREFEARKASILARVRVYDSVRTFIEEARRRGLRVALSTNNECRLVSALDELKRIFDVILCHDPETGVRKGRDHVRILQDMYDISMDSILFIGDSDYDIELYSSLGVRTLKTKGIWRDHGSLLEYLEHVKICEGGR